MKVVFIPLVAALALSVMGPVFAGTVIVPEPKPSLTVTPIVPPAETKIEPVKTCSLAAQQVCETKELKVELNDTPKPQVQKELKVELKETPEPQVQIDVKQTQPESVIVKPAQTQS